MSDIQHPSDRHAGRRDGRTSAGADRSYVPAAGRHWRLPLYDLMAKLVGAEAARERLIQLVAPHAGERVLDIGSGTGALAIALKRRHPDVDVVGIDPDPRALAIARARAARASLAIAFDRGFADALPYADGSFERVTSSLMFHHLSTDDKSNALREVRRVLAPGGTFHMLDFDGPEPKGAGLLSRRLHSHRLLRDSAERRVLELLRAAGLASPRVIARRAGALAHMSYYEASAPHSRSSAAA